MILSIMNSTPQYRKSTLCQILGTIKGGLVLWTSKKHFGNKTTGVLIFCRDIIFIITPRENGGFISIPAITVQFFQFFLQELQSGCIKALIIFRLHEAKRPDEIIIIRYPQFNFVKK